MLVKKTKSSNIKPIETYKTKYIWCDGWVFDSTKKIKLQHIPTSLPGYIFIKKEATGEVYSDPHNFEDIEVSILSKKPLIWKEKGDTFEDVYTEIPVRLEAHP